MSYRIPFNRPCFAGNEHDYINHAIAGGKISGDGEFTRRCNDILRELTGAGKVLLTTSCTHALEMAAILLNLAPGDEIVAPSFTFVSTASAFMLRGAAPRFCDIRPDTLNLDERLLPGLITDKTKAVVVVHYAGVACEMDAIAAVCRERGLALIEDNAHGLFGAYKDRPLGSFGCMSAQSFHETKNVICGEGGSLGLNDPKLYERAEIIREKGTNRARFFRGEVDKYTWVDVGSSYLPSEVLAAFLYAQLEHRAQIQAKRRAIWERYDESLASWAAAHGVGLPKIPAHCRQAYHMFQLVMPDAPSRDRFIESLKKRGILSVFHYLPLHLSPVGVSLGGRPGQCPVTEDVSARLVRLPFYNDLAPADQDDVIAAVLEFR